MADAGSETLTVGEAVVGYLEARGVSTVFGIPGVHTIDLYRGLGSSSIQHVTPRHEQGAGFMADGYARASGELGVAFVITGPGVTNIITPMAQARADSIPMLIVCSVNEDRYLGRGLGHLHELPDQLELCRSVAVRAEHVSDAAELIPMLDSFFEDLGHRRAGPMLLQVPLDVLGHPFPFAIEVPSTQRRTPIDGDNIAAMAQRLINAERPVMVVGGGTIDAEESVRLVAEHLDAPVVQTINARGLLYGHRLQVPASPSLLAVRSLLEEADVVLAVGTELGPTDFDIYNTGTYPQLDGLVRIDIDADQLARHPTEVALHGRAEEVLPALLQQIQARPTGDSGSARAEAVKAAARAELSTEYRGLVAVVETIRDTLPGSAIVGDSTQLLYAANLYYGHDSPRGWFNSSVGFGALGYAIPAAVGAALASPSHPVVCITGDGGAQFTLPEVMTAVDENLPVIFIVWNNFAYQEIADAMRRDDVEIVGCDPTPPNFEDFARACSIPYLACSPAVDAVAAALRTHGDHAGPMLIEIQA